MIKSLYKKFIQLAVLAVVVQVSGNAYADFAIKGTPAGTPTNLTLSINVQPDQYAYGFPGSFFVAARLQNGTPGGAWYYPTPTGWQQWNRGSGAPLPPYMTTIIQATNNFTPIVNMDVSSYPGATIYAGYGSDMKSMMQSGTWNPVYIIPGTPAYGFYRVKLAGNQIASINFIRNSDGKIIAQAYPYGMGLVKFATKTQDYDNNAFQAFINARLTSNTTKPKQQFTKSAIPRTSATQSAVPDCTLSTSPNYPCSTGLSFGYNTSTGYISNNAQCYNYTTTGYGLGSQTNLSSSTSISSLSQSLNVTASISGTYDAVTASDTFTYSSNYNNSAYSGQTYMTAGSLYSLNSTLDINNAFTPYANSVISSGAFDSACGNSFVNSVTAGFVVSTQLIWSSNSSSSSTNISNSVSVSYGVDSISAAVNAANTTSNSNTQFDLTSVATGGGEAASTTFMNGVSTAMAANSATCFAQPSNSDTSTACNNLANGIQTAATNAINQFNSSITPNAQGNLQNLGNFAVFPNGVASLSQIYQPTIQYQQLTTYSPPLIQCSSNTPNCDIFSPYSAQIANYLNLYNQIQTLQQRANILGSALSSNINYDMPPFDLANVANNLSNIYSNDANITLKNNLQSCMQSSSTNIAGACSNIVSLYNSYPQTTAYNFYGTNLSLASSNPSSLTSAQQNTIALQYAGTMGYDSWDVQPTVVPVAGLWIPSIPQGVTGYDMNGSLNTDNAAFVAFAYQPWFFSTSNNGSSQNGYTVSSQWINWVPIYAGYGGMTQISTEWLSPFGWYAPVTGSNSYQGTFYPPDTLSTSNTCSSPPYTLYSSPCGLILQAEGTTGGGQSNVANRGTLNPISSIFGTPLVPVQ